MSRAQVGDEVYYYGGRNPGRNGDKGKVIGECSHGKLFVRFGDGHAVAAKPKELRVRKKK